MVRLLLSFVATVVVARWVYSEVEVSFPAVVPYIDSALERAAIPTHDRWDRQKVEEAANSLVERAEVGLQAFRNFKDELTKPLPSRQKLQARVPQASQSF